MLRYSCVFLFAFLLPIYQAGQAAYSNEYMLCLVNKERTSRGLPAMGLDPLLTKAAQMHSDDQARMNSMSHTGSDGSSADQRLTRVGFQWNNMAENVAMGYQNSDVCMTGWMNSPGHKANILGPCEMFGSAVAYSSSNAPYYTQDFGKDGKGCRNVPKCNGSPAPASAPASAPAPAPAPTPQPSYGQPQQPNYGGQQPNYGGQQPSYGGQQPSYGGGQGAPNKPCPFQQGHRRPGNMQYGGRRY